MNDAPERMSAIKLRGAKSVTYLGGDDSEGFDATDYIRADLFDEQAKENKKLWADVMDLRRRLVSAALKP